MGYVNAVPELPSLVHKLKLVLPKILWIYANLTPNVAVLSVGLQKFRVDGQKLLYGLAVGRSYNSGNVVTRTQRNGLTGRQGALWQRALDAMTLS